LLFATTVRWASRVISRWWIRKARRSASGGEPPSRSAAAAIRRGSHSATAHTNESASEASSRPTISRQQRPSHSCRHSGQASFVRGHLKRPGKYGNILEVRLVLLVVIATAAHGSSRWVLRDSSQVAEPLLETYPGMAGCLIMFRLAANPMVRFRGTQN
jgi:hypothetical protein